MTTEQHLAKVNRVIMAVLNSPNRNTQRAALWFKLQDLREKLQARINNPLIVRRYL